MQTMILSAPQNSTPFKEAGHLATPRTHGGRFRFLLEGAVRLQSDTFRRRGERPANGKSEPSVVSDSDRHQPLERFAERTIVASRM